MTMSASGEEESSVAGQGQSEAAFFSSSLLAAVFLAATSECPRYCFSFVAVSFTARWSMRWVRGHTPKVGFSWYWFLVPRPAIAGGQPGGDLWPPLLPDFIQEGWEIRGLIGCSPEPLSL